jgi:hypothetical protein
MFIMLPSLPATAQEGLTIYNDNFAVVRDTVELDLQEGSNDVQVTDVTRRLETDSVILRDPTGQVPLQILEQSYRNDPLNEVTLYEYFEGETIDFKLSMGGDARHEIVPGKILRAPIARENNSWTFAEPLLVEIDGSVRVGSSRNEFEPLFPALPDDKLLKPTLRWLLQSPEATQLKAELSYMTGGLSWKAAYNAVLPEEGDQMDFIGWITMDNKSGKTFTDADIQLMAGDVNRVKEEDQHQPPMARSFAAREVAEPPVTEETFDEYHLYTLQNRTTLYDQERKQVEFIRAEDVTADQVYVYNGFSTPERMSRGRLVNLRNDPNYGTQSNSKVWIMREFLNSEENNLGMPLPAGILRFYRRGAGGKLQFVGENTIDHTPRDETVRVYTGNAFDLVGERKQTNFERDNSQEWIKESIEIKVRNRKEEESVTIRVVEDLYRWFTWEILESSMDYQKTAAQEIEFRVPLEPGEEKTVTYTVEYSW